MNVPNLNSMLNALKNVKYFIILYIIMSRLLLFIISQDQCTISMT